MRRIRRLEQQACGQPHMENRGSTFFQQMDTAAATPAHPAPDAARLHAQLLLHQQRGGWRAVERAMVKPAGAVWQRRGGAEACCGKGAARASSLPSADATSPTLESPLKRRHDTNKCNSLPIQPLVVVGVEVGQKPVAVGRLRSTGAKVLMGTTTAAGHIAHQIAAAAAEVAQSQQLQ